MQSNGSDCHTAATQQNEHHPHHAPDTHATTHAHHGQLAANHDMPSGQPDSSCKNHAICHLACCGYMANTAPVIVAEQQPDRAFTPYLVTPRTLTLPLFDPPPLARS